MNSTSTLSSKGLRKFAKDSDSGESTDLSRSPSKLNLEESREEIKGRQIKDARSWSVSTAGNIGIGITGSGPSLALTPPQTPTLEVFSPESNSKEARSKQTIPKLEAKVAPITISTPVIAGVVESMAGSTGSDKSVALLSKLVSNPTVSDGSTDHNKKVNSDIKGPSSLSDFNTSSQSNIAATAPLATTTTTTTINEPSINDPQDENRSNISNTTITNPPVRTSQGHSQSLLSSSWYSWAWTSVPKQENPASIPTTDSDHNALNITNPTNNNNAVSSSEPDSSTNLNVDSNTESKPASHSTFEPGPQHPTQPPTQQPGSWYSSIFTLIGSNRSNISQNESPVPDKAPPSISLTSNSPIPSTPPSTPPNPSSPQLLPASPSDTESLKDPNVIAGPSGDRSWAFWFRSSPQTNCTNSSHNHSSEQGELAISGTSTQTHPRTFKRTERSVSPEGQQTVGEEQLPVIESSKTSPQPNNSSTTGEPAIKKPRKVTRPNIVTPTLDESYQLYTQSIRFKSSVSKFSQYLLPSLRDNSKTQYYDHPYRCAPQKLQKVVVIGVHGYFPARVVRTLLGEPTGTSVKFANEAAESVERWADEKGYKIKVDKIALEGEGKVLKRVDNLYQLLMNWLHLIHEADFIYFAAHSQGTPVAVHLLARLVEDGHVENKRIALLGMAGISLGPMSGLDQKLVMRAISSIESDSLTELFEFQRPDSRQSRKYFESLRVIIAHNAKLVFVGSLDDQLVPLYSSTCSHISHPNIYRAVYIDGEDVAPEFISNLLSIALRLRNIGSTDHGVIRELSGALAGAITGKGHSKIYNESQVYDLTLRYALETTDVGHTIPVKVDTTYEIPKPNHNPYLLPWAMRGLLNEALKRTSFIDKVHELYEEFDSWQPQSKVLKDVRYRLSAIQSKL